MFDPNLLDDNASAPPPMDDATPPSTPPSAQNSSAFLADESALKPRAIAPETPRVGIFHRLFLLLCVLVIIVSGAGLLMFALGALDSERADEYAQVAVAKWEEVGADLWQAVVEADTEQAAPAEAVLDEGSAADPIAVAEVMPTVVSIQVENYRTGTKDRVATGVVIREDGLVLTSLAALSGREVSQLWAVAGGKKRMRVRRVYRRNPAGGIVILQVAGQGLEAASLPETIIINDPQRAFAIESIRHGQPDAIAFEAAAFRTQRSIPSVVVGPPQPLEPGAPIYNEAGALLGIAIPHEKPTEPLAPHEPHRLRVTAATLAVEMMSDRPVTLPDSPTADGRSIAWWLGFAERRAESLALKRTGVGIKLRIDLADLYHRLGRHEDAQRCLTAVEQDANDLDRAQDRADVIRGVIEVRARIGDLEGASRNIDMLVSPSDRMVSTLHVAAPLARHERGADVVKLLKRQETELIEHGRIANPMISRMLLALAFAEAGSAEEADRVIADLPVRIRVDDTPWTDRYPLLGEGYVRAQAQVLLAGELVRQNRMTEAEHRVEQIEVPAARDQACADIAILLIEGGDLEAARPWIARTRLRANKALCIAHLALHHARNDRTDAADKAMQLTGQLVADRQALRDDRTRLVLAHAHTLAGDTDAAITMLETLHRAPLPGRRDTVIDIVDALVAAGADNAAEQVLLNHTNEPSWHRAVLICEALVRAGRPDAAEQRANETNDVFARYGAMRTVGMGLVRIGRDAGLVRKMDARFDDMPDATVHKIAHTEHQLLAPIDFAGLACGVADALSERSAP